MMCDCCMYSIYECPWTECLRELYKVHKKVVLNWGGSTRGCKR